MKTLYDIFVFGIALVALGACGPSPTPTSPDDLKAQELTLNEGPTATAASDDTSAPGKVASDAQTDDATSDDAEELEDNDVYGGQYGTSAEEEYDDDEGGDDDDEGGDDDGEDDGDDYDEDGADLF